jgi:hypothetical protein
MSSDPNAISVINAVPGIVQASALAEKIISLASTPGLNPEMFDRLVEWQKREEAAQAEQLFNEAMNLAQAEIDPVARTAENKQTNSFYAKLEAVDAAIRPIYLRHGFNVAYNTTPPLIAGNIRVECEVSLGRHSKKYHREAPSDTLGPKGSAVKTVLHGGGSTETYLKRYAVCGAFNVVFCNQDDDGVRGGKRFIGADQIAEIVALLGETGRQEGPFLDRLFGGTVRSVEEIEAGSGYLAAKSTLEGIKAQQARKGAPT